VRGFLNHFFDRFAGFASEFLDPANQFFLFAFNVLEIAIRELGPQPPRTPVPISLLCSPS